MSIASSARVFISASALALITLVPAVSQAFAPDGEAEATRISSAGRTLKWNWQPPGKGDRYGHGEAIVHAPADKVKDALQDYAHYRNFNPARFSASNVVGHPDGKTDVYMQFSVMGGMVKLWNVLRFAAPRVLGPGTEVVEGRFVRGNIKDANVIWTVKEVNAEFTVVKCDILMKPDLPAPQSALDEELRDAAQQAVDGIRERAQGHKNWVRFSP